MSLNSAILFAVQSGSLMILTFPQEGVTPGSKVTTTCQAGSSNPEITITWTQDTEDIEDGDKFTIQTSHEKGAYNSFQSQSMLSFEVTEKDIWSMFQCEGRGHGFQHKQPLKSEPAILKGMPRKSDTILKCLSSCNTVQHSLAGYVH